MVRSDEQRRAFNADGGEEGEVRIALEEVDGGAGGAPPTRRNLSSEMSRRLATLPCRPSVTWMCALMLFIFLIKYFSTYDALSEDKGGAGATLKEMLSVLQDMALSAVGTPLAGYSVQKVASDSLANRTR